MNTKLTLTIEQTVIEKAKKYAKDNERSLSDLIENYLKALTKESDVNRPLCFNDNKNGWKFWV